MPYVTVDAPRRVELDACVSCGLCLPHCPTFRLTGRESASPRGRLAAMGMVLDGIGPIDDAFEESMAFCLQCRACEAVCPSLVPFGRAMEGARVELAAQRPTGSRRMRRLLLGPVLSSRPLVRAATWAAAIAQRIRLAPILPAPLRRALAGLRPIDPLRRSWVGRTEEPVGAPLGTAAVLAGCVMDPWFGSVHDATVGLLRRAGYRVVVPEAQTCCGALAAHDGHAEEARRMAPANVAAFADADVVVSDSAGCTAHLKEARHWAEGGAELERRVRDATELVAELIEAGRLPRLARDRGRVAVQDPCHLRHAQRIVREPREMLLAAGYRPVEIDPDGLCCGAAGVYSILEPEASNELGRRKADQVRGTGVSVVASANPGCEMQLRAHLDGGHRVAHPVELYWEALSEEGGGR